MTRSASPHNRGFLMIAGLLVMACGNKSAATAATTKIDSDVSAAGTVAKSAAAPGKAGSPAVVGGANGAATVAGSATSGRDGGVSRGEMRDQRDAAVSGSGGANGSAAASGSAEAPASVAVGGSGGASGSATRESGRDAMAGVGGTQAQGSDVGVQDPTVTVSGQVIEVHADGSFTPYAGAEVCVLDSQPPVCASADADAKVAIKMPANSRTGFTMNLPDLFPMLTPITTGTTDINLSGRGEWSNYGAAVVLTKETRSAATAMLKTTLDMTKGQADMIVFGLGSGTVTLEGAPAQLKWFSSAGQFTVTDGPAPLGSVLHGFINIEPGMRTFRVENNGQPCKWDPMIWAGDEPGTITVPIRAGWWTRLMEVRCD